MKFYSRCLLASCAFGVAMSSAANRPQKNMSPLLEIPFKLESRLPTVDAEVAGKPASLFIDLGGYRAIALVARKESDIPLKYSDKVEQWRNSEGKVFTSRLFSVSTLKVGSTDFGAMDGVELPAEDRTFAQDGYLGFPALSRFMVVMDYPKSKMRLYPPGSSEALKRECGDSFPLQIVSGVVQSTIDTNRGPLIFQWDTGSTENVLRPSALSEANTLKEGGNVAFTKFVVGKRDVGRIRFPLREFVAPNVDGVLGTDFFESKVVCFDLQNQVGGLK